MAALRKILGWSGIWLVCVLVLAGCAGPKATPAARLVGPPSSQRFEAGQHGALGFELPGGWLYTRYQTSPVVPASFQLDTPDQTSTIRFSVSWDGIDRRPAGPTDQELERLLRGRAERQIRLSVEDNVNVKTVLTAGGHAQFAQFTESIWVNAEVAPGNYRYVTHGVFRCGNLWGTFTIHSQDKTGESFRPALAVVQSLRKLDPEP